MIMVRIYDSKTAGRLPTVAGAAVGAVLARSLSAHLAHLTL